MPIVNEFLALLRDSSESDQLDMLRHCSRERLLLVQHAFGFPDCNCDLEILPCPMHSQWEEWREDEYTDKQIADAWRAKTRERIEVSDVTAFFDKAKRSCDCSLFERVVPCAHLTSQEYILGWEAQMLVLERLRLRQYVDPDQSPFPHDTGDVQDQVRVMAERVALGLSPFHPEDTFRNFHKENFVQEARHGPSGRDKGHGGRSLSGNYFNEKRK